MIPPLYPTTCRKVNLITALDCGPPLSVNDGEGFIACDPNVPLPDPGGTGCPPHPTTISQDLATLSGAALQASAGNIPLPNGFRTVRFSDGTRRTVLESEIPLLDDCIKTGAPVRVDSAAQVFYVQTPTGGGNATLSDALALRAAGMALAIAGPDPNAPQPGAPPLGNIAEPLKFTFFIYDHLGNSRILYANTFESCDPAGVRYLLEHVLDYYPYGKTLREYVHNRERFQTTGHERDAESGLDHRGARNYDGDVGRFLGVDPLAVNYAAWSTYNYVLGNPVIFVDPNGMDVYRYDYETGELVLERQTADDFDQIGDFKYNKKSDTYELKTKKNGEAKTLVTGIAKGILHDRINFRDGNNIIEVNGAGQPTEAEVERFIVAYSDHVIDVEVSGYGLGSSPREDEINAMLVWRHSENSKDHAVEVGYMANFSIRPEHRGAYGGASIFPKYHFHTHPERGEKGNVDLPSPTDNIKVRERPNMRHYIFNYRGRHPY